MCWKYEAEYDDCFDFTWAGSDYLDGLTGIVDVLDEAGVEFVEGKSFFCRDDFFKLLSKWHEEGAIKPKDKVRTEREIEESLKEIAEGKYLTFDEVKKELNL